MAGFCPKNCILIGYIKCYIFLTAGIKNLFVVYAHGFPNAVLLAHGARYDLFRHRNTSLKWMAEADESD